jgi:WD40 repeat protein
LPLNFETIAHHDRLLDVVDEWERACQLGQACSLEELCGNDSRLLESAQVVIDRLNSVNDRLGIRGSIIFSADTGSLLPDQFQFVSLQRQLPGYELLEEIGRGGMGVVFKARQLSLNRFVAIKTVPAGSLDRASLAQRLRAEAHAMSRLAHPHVVQIVDVHDSEDLLCLVMEYLDGADLSREPIQLGMEPLAAARLVHTVALTMADVHAAGILHRDLKPSNILKDRQGTIKLTDFGLAHYASRDADITATAELIGSPKYMAPEQAAAANDQISERTDVYGIGATLYYMLTGRPPLAGGSVVETLDQIRNVDPVPPRRLRPEIPRDLDAICMKCLEKKPGKRYASAALLADDLARLLAGRPTLARPISALGRVLRWVKRNPAQAAVAGTVAAALGAIIFVSTWYAVRLAGAERETDLKKRALDAEVEKSRLQDFSLLTARIRERSMVQHRGWAAENLTDLKMAAGEAPHDESRRRLRSEAVQSLCAVDLDPVGIVVDKFDNYGLTYSPDGRVLAAGINRRDDGVATVVLYDADTRQETRRLSFEAVQTPGGPSNRVEGVRSLLFTPDGKRLFVGTRTGMIHVWNFDSERVEHAWPAHEDFVVALELMQNDQVLASLSEDWKLRAWRLPSGEQIAAVDLGNEKGLIGNSLAIVGDRIYLTTKYGLREYRLAAGKGQIELGWEAESRIGCLASLPDRRTVLCLGDAVSQIELTAGIQVRRLFDPRHTSTHLQSHDVDVSPDGHWAVTCGYDAIKLWDLVGGTLIREIPNSANQRISAAFRPASGELAVARNSRVEIWRIAASGIWDTAIQQSFPITFADLSADGRTAIATVAPPVGRFGSDQYSTLCVSGTEPGASTVTGTLRDCAWRALGISRDGRIAACNQFIDQGGSLGGCLVLVDLDRRGEPGWPGEVGSRKISHVHRNHSKPLFSADASRLWFACELHDAPHPGCISQVPTTSEFIDEARWVNERSERKIQRSSFLAISAGDRVVAASSVDEAVRFFHADDGRLMNEFPIHGHLIDCVQLCNGERSLVCGTREGKLLVLNADVGEIVSNFAAHDDSITAVTISANGLLFSACRDGTLAAWRLAGTQLMELFRIGPLHRGIKDAVVSRSGDLLMLVLETETGVRLLRIDMLRRRLAELGLDW